MAQYIEIVASLDLVAGLQLELELKSMCPLYHYQSNDLFT